MKKILIRGGSLVTLEGLKKADVLISVTGEIDAVQLDVKEKNANVIDAEGKLLFPLLIDCHVHFREPGLEHKGTMETESAAALAGGVGTVCEMPNTIPPTVTVATLADKVRRASHIDGCVLKFFFGVTEALHLQTLRDLWTGTSMELKRLKHHCAGVKLYLDHSTGDQKVDSFIIEDIFQACADLHIPLVAHCEDSEINQRATEALKNVTHIAAHSEMRPPEAEAASIEYALGFVRKYGTAFHIAHLSTKQGIDLVRKAKKEKLPVTCEVAPHHLFLTIDDYETLGALGKMNPPLRTTEHQGTLWEGIFDGTVDCIATDHAPHTLEEKNASNPLEAPSGVPGVETMLPLLLSMAAGHFPHPSSPLKAQDSQLTYEDIFRLCFTNPNKIFSLSAPSIAPKEIARIAIVDPDAEWTIKGKNLKSKCGWTPYEGWTMKGRVTGVIGH